jgi:uncharacterized membrane protein YidH (DUF202 family)
MAEQRDYSRDIAEIRSMMERSSKFLSLSGWSGILAGLYGLAGFYLAYYNLQFHPVDIWGTGLTTNLSSLFMLAIAILVLALGSAIYLSVRKAHRRGETAWNTTSKLLMLNLSVPLLTGGLLIFILYYHGLLGLLAPTTLLFYGLAIYNASKFTFDDMKVFGLIQIALGVLGAYYIPYGMWFWAVGFGLVHIGFGIYMHLRYER